VETALITSDTIFKANICDELRQANKKIVRRVIRSATANGGHLALSS
jgi:hypothetical protein